MLIFLVLQTDKHLVYNSTNGKWENGAGGTGSITFTGSTIDSDDSSQIVFTPSSNFQVM